MGQFFHRLLSDVTPSTEDMPKVDHAAFLQFFGLLCEEEILP